MLAPVTLTGNTDFLDLLLQAADNPQMHNVQLPKNWIRDNVSAHSDLFLEGDVC